MFFNFRTRAGARALAGVAVAGLGSALGAAFLVSVQVNSAAAEAEAAQLSAAAVRGYAAPSATAASTPVAAAAGPAATFTPAVAATTIAPPQSPRDLDCLATAVYYEARGETAAGQAAVAQVVLNRARHPAYPKGVCDVVYQGLSRHACQFSFVCNGAMNRSREPGAWLTARNVASRALGGYVMLAIGRATDFHAAHGDGAGHADGAVRLGGQVFYVATRASRGSRLANQSDQPVASSQGAARQPRMTFALGLLTPVGGASAKPSDAAAETRLASGPAGDASVS